MSSQFDHEFLYRGYQDEANYLQRLRAKSILICGVGAIGSNLTESLVRVGATNLTILDKDRAEKKNVATQVYGDQAVGNMKAAALKQWVFRTTGADIGFIGKEINEGNVASILTKKHQLVIDCFDNSKSRQLLQSYCRKNNMELIHAGLSNDGYGEVVWDSRYRVPKDPPEGDVCDYPLARNLILLTVAVLAEEVLDFLLSNTPRRCNWTVTLKDLAIRRMA